MPVRSLAADRAGALRCIAKPIVSSLCFPRYLDDKLTTRVSGATAFVATRIEVSVCSWLACAIVLVLLISVQHHEQSSSCLTPDNSSCIASYSDNSQYQDRYIAWVENFTLAFQHGFTIPNNNKVQSFRAQSMQGKLNNGTGFGAEALDVYVSEHCHA
jgi:hypothetical protein